MDLPATVAGRKYTSHAATAGERSRGMVIGKRPRAILRIVPPSLSMIADMKFEEAQMGLFTVRLPVIAIFHGDLFVGNATAHLNRKGSIDLQSVLDANDRCFGSFRFADSTAGIAEMQCNDGSTARLPFRALSTFSGYGSGSTSSGPASFTFGLRPEVAALHLILPAGKKLVERSEGLRLVSVESSR